MPVLDGLAATRQLVEAGVPTSVLVLTTFDLDEYVFEALRAGASGFLLKDAPAEELAAAIRVVAAGDSLLAPGVTRRVIDAFVRRGRPVDPPGRPAARAAHAARARGARPARARPVEPRHRPPALRLRGHHQDPRQQRADQARPARPRAGRDLRLRERRRRARAPKISRTAEGRTRRATDPRRGRLVGRSSHDDDDQLTRPPTPPRRRPRRPAPRPSRPAGPCSSPPPCSPAASRSSARSPTRPPASPATKMIQIYIDNPGPLQWKSTGYHWAYAFWIAAGPARRRLRPGPRAWLATSPRCSASSA